jgi:hypothetical protein
MSLGYIDLKGIDHFHQQAQGGGIFEDRLWRESYYFNMTDPISGISLLTTIGFLPNKKRSTGFVLVLKDNKVVLFKLLAAFKRPSPEKYTFRLKGLEYSVEGAGWRLRYQSKKCAFDILFTPINRIYPYMNEGSDNIFSRIGTQHYEQFGTFSGTMALGRGNGKIRIGPCLGHRDHSWGIRDWSAVDRWRLFCCAFSKDLAINLWEGRIASRDFVKGYVFDGSRNTAIIKSEVRTRYKKDGRRPEGAIITVQDEAGREYEIRCKVLSCVTFPLKGSVLYETFSHMRCNGMTGTGLLEYLYHENSRVPRIGTYLRLLSLL